jgi:hypothetical protein
MKCTAAVPAFDGVSNYCFSIPIIEHSIRTKFYASGLSGFRTAVAFLIKNYGKPRTGSIIQNDHLRLFGILRNPGFEGYLCVVLNLRIRYTLIGSLIMNVVNSA